MKAINKYLITTLFTIVFCGSVWSQKVTLNANINIGTPSNYTYYYFPDYEVYYGVEANTWFILQNGIWIGYNELPYEYYIIKSHDCKRVMIPYHGPKQPYVYHYKYKKLYPKKNHHGHSNKYKVSYTVNTVWKSNKQNKQMNAKVSNHGGHNSKGKHNK